MRIILYAFLLHSLFRLVHALEREETTLAGVEKREEKEEEEEAEMGMEEVGMTEEVMDPKIKITDVPDVEETTEEFDPSWDKNKVIRDVAYYIRGHKFGDFDRRYYKRYEDAEKKPYEEFPKPALRSLHWEVHRLDNYYLFYFDRIWFLNRIDIFFFFIRSMKIKNLEVKIFIR